MQVSVQVHTRSGLFLPVPAGSCRFLTKPTVNTAELDY
jgi:hypothetical protein